MRHFFLLAAACAVCLMTSSVSLAQMRPISGLRPMEIEELVQKLEGTPEEQQAATTKLIDAGADSVGPVAKLAEKGAGASMGRAFQILQKLAHGKEEFAKKDATEALEKLSKSENPRVANTALAHLRGRGGFSGTSGGVFRVESGPGGSASIRMTIGGGKRVTSKSSDGVKETEVDEPARKVKIVESDKDGIKMEITEKKDGKEGETKKVEAKNAEELKKKDADAHKLYEEYSKSAGVSATFEIGPAVLPAFPGPDGFPTPIEITPATPGIRPLDPVKMAIDIKSAQTMLEVAIETLKKAEGSAEGTKKALALIEAARKTLQDAQGLK